MTKIPSVEERVAEKFNGSDIFWKVILKHLTPETIAFIKNDYIETLTADRTALLTELREWAEEIKRCNSSEEHSRRRDHATKSGYEIALDGLQAHLDELINPSV